MGAKHAIEHPGSIGEQNRHILNTLSDAYRASLELAEQGFTILKVSIKERNPKVFIQGCGRCHRLHGYSAATRHGPNGREHVMVANIKGAQVEWVERG